MFRTLYLIRRASLVLLAVVVLTACGGAPPAAPPAATSAPIVQTQVVEQTKVVEKVITATPPPAATAAPKPKGKITVWMWKATEDSIVKPGVVKDFNAEYPDVQVEWVTYNPADVYQKLPLALSAGTGAPDVAYVEDSHLAKFVALGGLADLTDRVKPYIDKFNTYKWQAGEKDGKYYSVPLDSGPVVMYYRRDLFKTAGLPDDPDKLSDTIKTWDDYLAACKTIKEKTGAPCFPASKAKNSARLYEMMLWQQGLGYYNQNGEVTVDSPENIATLEILGQFWKNDLTYDEEEWTDNWYAGFSATTLEAKPKPVATFVEAAWMGVFFKTWIAPGTAGKWGVALMPTMKPGQVRAANDGGSGFVIPDQSQNKDAAWAFIEFVTARSQEQNKIFAYGDIFPALEASYDDPIYVEPDAFFGGQQTRKVYVDVVKQIPSATVYGPYYQEMNGFVATAIQKFATGAASASDALKEAAASIRQQTGLK
jgi:lactose/L-arabinose transport system substrate-binding protein